MAKNLTLKKSLNQRGFSMIELLVAATILAVGILGLAMLQAMALRASRGSSNMAMASRLADHIMDSAELEGRLSWLNITDANRHAPTLADLASFKLRYITIASGSALQEEFNLKGGPVIPSSDDPAESIPIFRASTQRVAVPAAGGAGSVGQMSDFSIRIEFSDEVDSEGNRNLRTFSITRRVIHG
jgi:prepilin-type N-terminal cleavage/methylation domain-containing protein